MSVSKRPSPNITEKLKSLDLEFLPGVPVHLTDAMVSQILHVVEQSIEFGPDTASTIITIYPQQVKPGQLKLSTFDGQFFHNRSHHISKEHVFLT